MNYRDGKYHAVDAATLRQVLGNQCSPMPGRNGYVIGPDINGRLCHCATCFSIAEAKRHIKQINHNKKNGV